MRTNVTKSVSKVWVPPETVVRLPVVTRPQELPFNELPWESFQPKSGSWGLPEMKDPRYGGGHE
ncbi:MAG: hypothetical protein O3A59_10450, partial [Nitrospirae bacterium]|nr:hypothetical protein [Nitrospirota bacterium]